MELRFIVSNQTNPYWNIAVEQYLVENESDAITLYLWKNRRTVVIGQNQNPYSEVNLDALLADDGYLMRRRTGGGAVYHDDGNLNFSFVVPHARYDQQRQFAVIQRAVESFGLHTELSGRNDILVETRCGTPDKEENQQADSQRFRKFSGNAFSKGLHNDLHHGTLLIRGNMDDLQRYLRPKPSKLLKHGVGSVQSRVVNLCELDASITAESIVPRLLAAFEAEYGGKAQEHSFDDMMQHPRVRALYEGLASDAWLYGNWRSFVSQRSGHFAWGEVELQLKIEDDVIVDVQLASDALDLVALDEARRLLVGATTRKRPQTEDDITRDILSLVY